MIGSGNQGAFGRALENFVFGNRKLVLALFAIVTLVMLFFAAQLRVDAGFKKQIPLDHEFMKTFIEYEVEFGGANRVLVAVIDKNGNMFNKSFMQTMENVTNDVISLDEVDDARVRSIFTPNVRFVEVVGHSRRRRRRTEHKIEFGGVHRPHRPAANLRLPG